MKTITTSADPISQVSRGRGPARQEEIVDFLRRQIVTGTLGPGARLPTRRELSVTFGASTRTVQDALDDLADDGFVVAMGTRGTFVSERPPHLSKYAFVFCSGSESNRFYSALNNDVLRRRRERAQLIDVWHNIDGHADNEDFMRLVGEVRRHRIAGLIFTTNPTPLEQTPLLEEPDIPRVAITRARRWSNVSTVSPDDTSFRHRAMDHMIACGVRRMAVILPEGYDDTVIGAWQADAAERGLDLRPYWTISINPYFARCARNITHLLFNPLQRELPDGLIIADDNLAEASAAGLVNSGVNVRDLNIVVHCNFPWPMQSVVPARRLGYSAASVIDACVRSIDRQLQQPGTITHEEIPAVFEDELVD